MPTRIITNPSPPPPPITTAGKAASRNNDGGKNNNNSNNNSSNNNGNISNVNSATKNNNGNHAATDNGNKKPPPTRNNHHPQRPQPPKPPKTAPQTTQSIQPPQPPQTTIQPLQPPPKSTPLQLNLWSAVFERRSRQIRQLNPYYFRSFANAMIKDLKHSRYGTNEFCATANEKQQPQQQPQQPQDLAQGYYSEHLLTKHPPPPTLSIDQVLHHLQALFYRSLDERLPPAMRKHALEATKRAFASLDDWLDQWKEWEKTKATAAANVSATANVNGGRTKPTTTTNNNSHKNNNNNSNSNNKISNNNNGNKHKRKSPDDILTTSCTATSTTGNQQHTHGNNSNDVNNNSNNNNNNNNDNQTAAANAPPHSGTNNNGCDGENNERPNKRIRTTASSSNLSLGTFSNTGADAGGAGGASQGAATAATSTDGAVPATAENNNNNNNNDDDDDSSKTPSSATVNAVSTVVPARTGKTFLPPRPPPDDDSDDASDANEKHENSSSNAAKNATTTSSCTTQQSSVTYTAGIVQQQHDDGTAAATATTNATSTTTKPVGASTNTNTRKGKELILPTPHSTTAVQSASSAGKVLNNQNDNNCDAASPSAASTIVGNEEKDSKEKEQRHFESNTTGDVAASLPQDPISTTSDPIISEKERVAEEEEEDNDGSDSDVIVLDLTEDSPPHESISFSNNVSSSESAVIQKGPEPMEVCSNTNLAIQQTTQEGNTAAAAAPAPAAAVTAAAPTELFRPSRPPPSASSASTPPPWPSPPSPPPSPPPATKILRHPPKSLPNPAPFFNLRNIVFLADNRNPIDSFSLKPRLSCTVSYDAGFHLNGSGACMEDACSIDIRQRLETWDPYWTIVEELGIQTNVAAESGVSMTRVGTRTTPCIPVKTAFNIDHPSSCAMCSIDLPKEISKSTLAKQSGGSNPWGVKWGQMVDPYAGRKIENYSTGDRRLIVRTLPLHRTPKDKKRSDTHIWPKGTFLTLVKGEAALTGGRNINGSSEKIIPIIQRRQQSHDPKLWKGMSHALDLTKEVETTNIPIGIKLCSREVVENSNGKSFGSYAIHAAICEYVDADDLYDQLMGNVDGGDVIIPKLSLRSARKMAKEYLANQTVSIDDSDDEGSTASNDEKKDPADGNCLTFSLLCSMSKTAMETPVRGRHCKHIQCFDLRNFLHSNKIVYGGRWRCGVCENILSVRDLVHCGLFQAMLDEYRGSVSGSRDKVALRSDGTWRLMDENKLRYANKRASGSSNDGANGNLNSSTKETEIIELL